MPRPALLVEFGKAVQMPFKDGAVYVQRDTESGYAFFTPPSDETLTEYYENTYSSTTSGYHTAEKDYEPAKNGYHAGRLIEFYRRFHDGVAPKTSFEFGCAYGGLVAEMARRGVDARGSDINSTAIQQGLQLKDNTRIFAAPNIESVAKEKRKVDLIYSMHALEHDPHCFEVIEKSKALLNDEGLLFVSVPNGMYIRALLQGFRNNYWAIYPDHLHMFTPGYIPALCKRTGFVPLHWDTNIIFQVEPEVSAMFAGLDDTQKLLWSALLNTAGHGMEVNMVLAVKDSPIAKRHAAKVESTLSELEAVRQREVKLRDAVAKAVRA